MKLLAARFAVACVIAACSSPSVAPATTATAGPPAPSAFTPTAFSVKVSGTGRPVIFIPGLASPGSVWDGTLAHLGGKVSAHVLTLAGFAGQPPIAGPLLAQVHDQIIEYIKANHLQRPIVVGHSLGGVLSLWLAETDPEIAAIVDVEGLPFLAGIGDPTATADTVAPKANAMRDKMAGMTAGELGGMTKQFLASQISKPDDLARMAVAAEHSDVPTVANVFAELLEKDLRADLSKIAAPVLIVAATDSGMPLDQLKAGWHAQVDAIPHVDLEFVDQAKHFVMLDQPDAFYALLDHALASAPP